MKKIAGIICLFLFSANATAGRIAELFSEGVLGNKWGDDAAQVEAAHPQGKWRRFGKVSTYIVQDGRPVLGIERPKNNILYGLNADGKLASVSIEYPFNVSTFSGLMSAAQESFGSPLSSKDEAIDFQAEMASATGVRWAEDEGIVVSLLTQSVVLSTKTILTISKVSILPLKSSAELGFE